MYRLRAATATGVVAVLVGLGAGCGGGEPPEPDSDRTPALQTLEPSEQPSADASPSVEPGEEESLTIRQGAVRQVFELRIGVAAVSEDEANLSIGYESDPDDEQTEDVGGAAEESFDLDSGYTVTIDEIAQAQDEAEDLGEGTGVVTVTVTAPE
ncbi:hypothetical protein F4561_005888 [Lipingzhangella halophila]|uniref:Uncharacterized protein n=1 Tax=Lipingzhangella halophila TaxID=1783352 RepID=A0A7W7W6K0_9ACTN|nr:hypothetical protein [Lipingzhangella halophila]MBB4934994.1 hypothetical protein [Lipingzhangella halophila]